MIVGKLPGEVSMRERCLDNMIERATRQEYTRQPNITFVFVRFSGDAVCLLQIFRGDLIWGMSRLVTNETEAAGAVCIELILTRHQVGVPLQ